MIEVKIVLGYMAVMLGFIAYGFYFKDIFKGRTRPHAFSWLIWALITAEAYWAQVVKGGGAGAWATGAASIICFMIGLLALSKKERKFSVYDWITLTAALVAILLWFTTNDPLSSVIILSVTDLIGSIPTVRKSIAHPEQETAKAYAMHGIKFAIAILALQAYSLTTWLFPATLGIANVALAALIVIRRKQINCAAMTVTL